MGKSADEHGPEDMNQSMMEASRKLQEAKRTVLDSEQIGLLAEWNLFFERCFKTWNWYGIQIKNINLVRI